jgi:hypothetical protein
VSRGKIIDHQITGKEKLAVTRTKDRSLDSLDSKKDSGHRKELEKLVGTWHRPYEGDEIPRLLRRPIKQISIEEHLLNLNTRKKELLRGLHRARFKKDNEKADRIKRQLSYVDSEIHEAHKRINDARSI